MFHPLPCRLKVTKLKILAIQKLRKKGVWLLSRNFKLETSTIKHCIVKYDKNKTILNTRVFYERFNIRKQMFFIFKLKNLFVLRYRSSFLR